MWDLGVLKASVTWVTGGFETLKFAIDRFFLLLVLLGSLDPVNC
jgi:hypothetical protein